MTNPKIIVSSAAMLQYLARIMEFLNDEAKLVMFEKELQIDGFRGGLLVESNSDFETPVRVLALRSLQHFLRSIEDQPLTISFDYNRIYIQSIII